MIFIFRVLSFVKSGHLSVRLIFFLFSCLLENEQRFGLWVLIRPNMLHILALISFPIALFSYVFVSLMGFICVIADNCLFPTLKSHYETFGQKRGPKVQKREEKATTAV